MGILKDQMIRHMQMAGFAQKSIDLYTCCINCFARHFRRSPLAISRAEAGDFLHFLRVSGRSESTLRIYLIALAYFYRMHGIAERIPEFTFKRRSRILPDILSQAEVFQLLEGCDSLQFKTIFTLIYSAGLRVSEAANLRPADIDFTRKQIHVRNGKNNKDRFTVLADKAVDLLRSYLLEYRPVDWLFFVPGKPAIPLPVDSIQQRFKALVRRAGITKRIHIHSLRHCFATHLLENNTNIFHIMHLLGHSQIQTTMVYLHMQALETLHVRSPLDCQHQTVSTGHLREQLQLRLLTA